MLTKQSKSPSPLAAISTAIKELLQGDNSQKKALEIASQFSLLYKQGLVRPVLGREAADQATSEIEKRLDIFIDAAGHHSKICRTLIKDRVQCATQGRITKDTLADLIADRFVRKTVAKGGLEGASEGIGFGCLDGILVILDLWQQQLTNSSTLEQSLEILKKVEELDKNTIKEGKTCFFKLGEPIENDGSLGKRAFDKISTLTSENLIEICKEKIDFIVTQTLKRAKNTVNDKTSMVKALTPQLLSLMGNPLLVSEFNQRCLDNDDEDLQDAAFGLLIVLVSRYGFEHPTYYSTLYNMVRKRETYSLPLLKIIEISLKSRKLSSKVLAAFLKVK